MKFDPYSIVLGVVVVAACSLMLLASCTGPEPEKPKKGPPDQFAKQANHMEQVKDQYWKLYKSGNCYDYGSKYPSGIAVIRVRSR